MELQYSCAGSGVAFPPPVVTTGISSAGRVAHERVYEKYRHDDGALEASSEKGGKLTRAISATTAIGVTTTVEQYYR